VIPCPCSGEERWVSVVELGVPFPYEISSAGRVRSLNRLTRAGPIVRFRPARIIRLRQHRGYAYAWFWLAQKRRGFRVHRLVAYAFLAAPNDNADQVNHRDGDRTHNCMGNLEWLHGEANRDDRNRRCGWAGYASPISSSASAITGDGEGCASRSSRPGVRLKKGAGPTSSSSESIPF
jgi:hypothetical protein